MDVDAFAILQSFLDFAVELLRHPAMVYVIGVAKIAITVLALMVVGVVMLREFMTHWALTPWRRRRYLVRGPGNNDWSQEELERWAAQLSMVRRRVRRRIDRPAHAVRIRLESLPQGGSRYTMESSWRFERVMLNPSLPGVTVTRLRPRPWSPEDPAGQAAPTTGPRP
jgi:hypothetical protein